MTPPLSTSATTTSPAPALKGKNPAETDGDVDFFPFRAGAGEVVVAEVSAEAGWAPVLGASLIAPAARFWPWTGKQRHRNSVASDG